MSALPLFVSELTETLTGGKVVRLPLPTEQVMYSVCLFVYGKNSEVCAFSPPHITSESLSPKSCLSANSTPILHCSTQNCLHAVASFLHSLAQFVDNLRPCTQWRQYPCITNVYTHVVFVHTVQYNGIRKLGRC